MLGVADGKLVLTNVEKSKLTPKFPDDRWPSMDRQWVETVYKDFGQSYTAGGPAPQPGQQPASGPQAGDFVRASQFIGKSVKSRQDEKLGSVEDLVVDLKSGEVRYAVFAAGGFLGFGSKLFAIPLGQFSVAAEGKELALAADKESLQKAEGFKRDSWPMAASRDWMQRQTKPTQK
jgi:sporulation protein YlmC with PRC-barrel domain